MLPALAGLLRVDLHDRPADRRPQPGRSQGPGPVQDHRLGGPGLGRIQQHRRGGDDQRLIPGQHPGPERRPGPRQADLQRRGQGQHLLRIPSGQGQRRTQLTGGELIPLPRQPGRTVCGSAGGGTAAEQLRHRRMLTRTGIRLNPVPPADHPDQLIIRHTPVPVTLPRRLIRELGQHRAARRGIQRLTRREPRRPAGVLTREPGRGARHPRAPAAGRHRPERGPDPGQTGAGHLRLRLGLPGGELPGLRDQRSQLRIIHPGRRRVIRILILRPLAITGIILTLRRQVTRLIHPLRPLRARRNQPPIQGAGPGMVTGTRGRAGWVFVLPGVLGHRCFAHQPRSVRMNYMTIKHNSEK